MPPDSDTSGESTLDLSKLEETLNKVVEEDNTNMVRSTTLYQQPPSPNTGHMIEIREDVTSIHKRLCALTDRLFGTAPRVAQEQSGSLIGDIRSTFGDIQKELSKLEEL